MKLHRAVLFLPLVVLSLRGGVDPVSVADSIGMVRVALPDQRFEASNDFKFSPDQRSFVVVTYRGNVHTWKNEYELMTFDVDEVLAFVNGQRSAAPTGTVLTRIEAASNDHAIRDLRWMADGKRMVFLVDGNEGKPAQVCMISPDNAQLTALTDHPRGVENFDVDPAAERVVYMSRVDLPTTDQRQAQFVVGNRSLNEITTAREKVLGYQFFFAAGLGKAPQPVGNPFPFTERPSQRNVWLSPDGRWAIGQKVASGLSPDWKLPPLRGYTAKISRFDDYFMGYPSVRLDQYVLLDLKGGKLAPALSAPKAHSSMRLSVSGAQWFPSSQAVLLLDTFLPLDGVSETERLRRLSHPAVVEYDPSSGTALRIVDHPTSDGGKPPREKITAAKVNGDGTVTLRWRASDVERNRSYAKQGAEWQMVGESAFVAPAGPRLKLSMQQNADTPPDILAQDTQTGKERLLTQLNPGLARLAFGKVEQRTWKDAKGRQWEGALVYPSDHVAGSRLPLVIQTSAAGGDGDKFVAREFLIDGPVYSSAYAARACAGRGMLVLQVPNPFPGDTNLLAQLEDTQLLVEGAVDALDRDGLIDRSRVGLVGFSNTCVAVWHILTHSSYEFAAAIVADGYSHSHWGYATTFGIRSPGMLYIDDLVMGGAVPWGERLKDWVALSPSFHLDNVKAAVRIELYDLEGIPADWDLYALLRRQRKPVEYSILTDGAHNNLKPRERFLSQSGNVDWLSFWLTGYEDPDPAKAEQFKRWRKLRDMRDAGPYPRSTAARSPGSGSRRHSIRARERAAYGVGGWASRSRRSGAVRKQ